jgi:hypothetical protein
MTEVTVADCYSPSREFPASRPVTPFSPATVNVPRANFLLSAPLAAPPPVASRLRSSPSSFFSFPVTLTNALDLLPSPLPPAEFVQPIFQFPPQYPSPHLPPTISTLTLPTYSPPNDAVFASTTQSLFCDILNPSLSSLPTGGLVPHRSLQSPAIAGLLHQVASEHLAYTLHAVPPPLPPPKNRNPPVARLLPGQSDERRAQVKSQQLKRKQRTAVAMIKKDKRQVTRLRAEALQPKRIALLKQSYAENLAYRTRSSTGDPPLSGSSPSELNASHNVMPVLLSLFPFPTRFPLHPGPLR